VIEFRCPSCGRGFNVADELAGRRARCKGCGGALTVPLKAPTGDATPKLPVRTRRLLADAAAMSKTFSPGRVIELIEAVGEPPDCYRLRYHVRSLERPRLKGKPQPRDTHEIEVSLPEDYPRLPPVCRMLTPVFHPNIDTSTICIGDHWTAGERLVDLCIRIGEMLAYQAYNIRSPLDAEAAMFADLSADQLPTDPRDLRSLLEQ
jgi:ubiquitin-protein ligase/DNA-directed RNA polymerase subunit RPC12/RpoP